MWLNHIVIIILIQTYSLNNPALNFKLAASWCRSEQNRTEAEAGTKVTQCTIFHQMCHHQISSPPWSFGWTFVQAYQRRWGVPQDEGSLWGGMIGLHQVFDDQMYPPWPNHAKIETPLARALIMMYYLVHDNLSLNLPFLAFILQKQRLFTFLLIVKL